MAAHTCRKRKRGRVEIIPMIDVMLFLLVFFIMITMQMISDKGLHIALPSSRAAHTLPHPNLVVNVTSDNQIVVHGRPMTLTQLTAYLETYGGHGAARVTIASSKHVPFEDFVHVMGACARAGITHVGIAATPTP